MSLFDQLVDEAMKNRPNLAVLRMVVEKELLHHDILRVLSSAGMLAKLTFIGGTCLRACYGSERLSEDLNFTGGSDFSRESLAAMAQVLVEGLKTKYGLQVVVSEPTRDTSNVDTWKLKVQTRPDRKDIPAQRINIDICAIPSYQSKVMMLLNPYGVEMGTGGLILQAESREEIFADKMVAFALRPNRIKYRDLWDISWLHQQSVKLPINLISNKLKDHHCETNNFLSLLHTRQIFLRTDLKVATEFRQEMRRFLPAELVKHTIDQAEFWNYLTDLIDSLCSQIQQNIATVFS